MLKIMSFIIKLDTRFLPSTHKLPPTFRRTHARSHKLTSGSGIPRLSAEFLNLGLVKEPLQAESLRAEIQGEAPSYGKIHQAVSCLFKCLTSSSDGSHGHSPLVAGTRGV